MRRDKIQSNRFLAIAATKLSIKHDRCKGIFLLAELSFCAFYSNTNVERFFNYTKIVTDCRSLLNEKKTWKLYWELRLKVQLCRDLLRYCVKRQLSRGENRNSDEWNKGNGKLMLEGNKTGKTNGLRFPVSLLTNFWKQVTPKMKI